MTRLPPAIAQLPPLNKHAPFQSACACKICGATAIPFDSVDFLKFCDANDYYRFGISGIPVAYRRCLSCGFIFTEDFDDWTKNEFAALIYNQDYTKVDGDYAEVRPRQNAEIFAGRFAGCEPARILDYGSGTGVFVEGMQARGFAHVEAYDPYSNPVRPTGVFDIITCFEVIEHSPDPVGTLGDMKSLLREDGCIVLSQTTQPPDILAIRGSWWYLAPRNGHVSTFSEEALVALGRRHGLALYRGGTEFGFASEAPSSYAAAVLRSVGGTFTTLRVQAPPPSPSAIRAWYPAEDDGVWRFRWTASGNVSWSASWEPVRVLQVRVPLFQEVAPGLAADCVLELDRTRKPVRLDRGELVAEFDVTGSTHGQVTLHLPDRVKHFATDAIGARGLAILVVPAPPCRG